jgi:hypothetical protein
MIGRGNQSTRRKPAPVPLCPSHTPHATRAAVVGSQQLTAWATARHWLGLQHFSNNEELMEGVNTWLSSKTADFYDTGIQKLISCHNKWLSWEVAYVRMQFCM